MKRLLPVVALMMACVAGSAHADAMRWTHTIATGSATDTTAVGMADSSGVLWTYGASRLQLLIKPNQPCRVAIMVKACGDSNSISSAMTFADTSKVGVFIWRPIRTLASAAADATIDSVAVLRHPGGLPTSDAAAVGGAEKVIEFLSEAGAAKWGMPRGVVVPLADHNGWPFVADFVQIRWRVLASEDGAGAAIAGPVKFVVALKCIP